MESIEAGALYVVATPIGNLGDITYRAVHIMKNVDLIAAEDTRKTRILMQHYGIQNKTISYHSYNLKTQTQRLINLLLTGKSVALVTDAGTPGISDPGYRLVQACVQSDIRVIPIPGSAAFVAALTASGLPVNRFAFEGFLPAKKGRQTRLQKLAEEERTVVLYESPHRLAKTVNELLTVWGDRSCVMAREITKIYEEFFRGTLSELQEHLAGKPVKGEIVLLVAGFNKKREKKYE